jgi:phosphate uptake regulator
MRKIEDDSAMAQHTARTFHMELDELARKITEMSRLVFEQIAASIKALAGRDLEMARGVIASRDTADTMHRDIQEKGILSRWLAT